MCKCGDAVTLCTAQFTCIYLCPKVGKQIFLVRILQMRNSWTNFPSAKPQIYEVCQSANRKSANGLICGRSANLKNLSLKICGVAICGTYLLTAHLCLCQRETITVVGLHKPADLLSEDHRGRNLDFFLEDSPSYFPLTIRYS
jgi:hypothetical protein